jgi:hypothetical protein
VNVNGNVTLIARWVAAGIAAMGLAYGYGALNTRVDILEGRWADSRTMIIQLTDVNSRLLSLEREVERFRTALERNQGARGRPGAP